MKKVEFVSLKSETIGYGMRKGAKFDFENYREIIKESNKVGSTADIFPLYKEQPVI